MSLRRLHAHSSIALPPARRAPGPRLLALALTLCAGGSQAFGPALIDASERALAADVAWLADRRVISVPLGTWPLPAATLRAALEGGRAQAPADAAALERVHRALARLSAPATLAFEVNTARHPVLDGQDPSRERGTATFTQQGGGEQFGFRVRLGARSESLGRDDDGPMLEGSYIAAAWGDTVLALGLLDRWWGPGTLTSPILSSAAPPVPSLLLRGDHGTPSWPLLGWIGPWGYELSFGRLTNYTPSGTQTIGMRLYSRPGPGWEVGLSRYIAWGGEGRPHSARALFNALTGRSNVQSPSAVDDPSNEIAGFDLRYSRPTAAGNAWSAYAHVVGEDEAGALPSKLLGTLGLQYKQALGEQRLEWTLEGADTETGRLFGLRGKDTGPAYVHGTYVAGHYHQGLPIGAHIGGGGRSLSAGLAWSPGRPLALGVDRVSVVATRARVSERGPEAINDSFGLPGRVNALSVRTQAELGTLRWHLGLSLQRYPQSSRPTAGIVAGLELPLDRGD